MRNISPDDCLEDAGRLQELIFSMGRLRSLRDPLANAQELHDLTPQQAHCLMALGLDGPLTMGDLAKRLCITEKTVTGVVDRLERDGHVKRERNASDRRVVRVGVTRKGSGLHVKLVDGMRERIARMMALLDAPDRKDLVRIAEKLLTRMKERVPDTQAKERTGT